MKQQDAIYALPIVSKQADLRRIWCRGRKTITPAQRVWTRYMLALWGKHLGGDDAPAGCVNVIGRLMIRSEWSHDQAERIVSVVNDLFGRVIAVKNCLKWREALCCPVPHWAE